MLIAHRGYYDEYIPENSMEAFKRCLIRNIPIELDVRLTKDKKVVVFHDLNLKRMTGLNKNIEKMNYEDIKRLHLKKSKETIPLLEDVLKLINNKVFLLVELKNRSVGPLERELLKLLKNYNNFYLQTFNLRSIYYLKLKSNYKVGLLLINSFSQKIKSLSLIDFISPKLNIISKLKTKKELFVWNIKTKEDLYKASFYTNKFIVYFKNFSGK